ncbi:MAG: hypothetical protein EOO09_10695 [Chitinophagaceae bacterium]|nr:MAG: hypothetical protein EOO09_10695 [Chitinophagaceae bacterium]
MVVFLSSESRAQIPVPATSNQRSKILVNRADSTRVDTVSIIPGTFSIDGISLNDYRLDYINATLYWLRRPETDTLRARYRVFGQKVNPTTQRMKYDSIMNNMSLVPYEFNNELSNIQKGIFNFGTMRAEGSFGRQISFGNSQDAVLNSTLNLQLSGMLGDSIEVQAAITDNNIPIQPDGTTQQLNEFDQVFLQFRKKNWQLNLGDIDIRQNSSYFLNFYKRLQGVSFQTTNNISDNITSRTLASGSIAKGKFTRNIITALEGNQGPYRLQGANGEIFFIVLANTERVFIDGQLLQRGEDQDYVINYNTAEVTFTPKRMITKDSRIQVEFEYADRNFLNANFYLSEEVEINQKLKLRVGAFTNTDSRNSSINQVLDPQQKDFLAQLGDSIQRAFYPSAALDTFAAGKILYEKIYIGADSLYRYSTDPALAKYNLSFIVVGQGNGNYVPDYANGANGKVYRYIEPVNGQRQGNYEPVTTLVTPKKQQLVNLGADYTLDKYTMVKGEVAMSNYDANTFSKINNGDDRGLATKIQVNRATPLRAKNNLQLLTGLDYEHVQQKFRPLERLRTVEFTRDWGLPIIVTPEKENILRATAGVKNNKDLNVSYQFTSYTRGNDYKGYQNSIRQFTDWKGWQLNNELVLTSYTSILDKGTFFRPTLDLSKQLKELKNLRLGFRYAQEKNEVRNRNTDTISNVAFSFDTYTAYLKTDESKLNRYGITFFTRSDKYPYGKSLVKGDRSYNLNLQAELLKNERHRFYFNTTFRKLQIYDTTISNQEADQTILGRVEYRMNEFRGLLNGSVLYEVGAGQEQRRDLAYFEVPAGTGQYAWIDYNNDGVQQLNEFELAAFPDQARFLRIFTPTNEFLKANYVTFNYNFSVNPRAILNRQDLKGLKALVAKFNLISSMQIAKKSIARGDFEFDPFKYGVTDTNLVTLNTDLLNTLSFNRMSSVWGIDIANRRSSGKSLLTYGYESRSIREWNSKLRINFSRSVALQLTGRTGSNSLYTPNTQFDNRNYRLAINSAEPTVSFIRGTNFRVSSGYKFEQKKNQPVYGGEKSTSHSLNLETKYNVLQNSSISGRLTYNNIDYSGTSATTTVSYIMLDGLLPGKNYLWNITLTKRLLNNLELNFTYDGRKPAETKTVHIGRASLTALF